MIRARLLLLCLPVLFAVGCERPADPIDNAPSTVPTPPSTAPAPEGTPDNGAIGEAAPADGAAAAPAEATVSLQPTQGNQASGELTLRAVDAAVHISGHVEGLQPGSEHGFHIHETGDCSAPDASSAGGHFAPAGDPHGKPGLAPHHAGDMPNLRANEAGRAQVDLHLDWIELGTGSPRDVAGRAVIVHAKPDDYSTQPSGDAGGRITCGVIEPIAPPAAG